MFDKISLNECEFPLSCMADEVVKPACFGVLGFEYGACSGVFIIAAGGTSLEKDINCSITTAIPINLKVYTSIATCQA